MYSYERLKAVELYLKFGERSNRPFHRRPKFTRASRPAASNCLLPLAWSILNSSADESHRVETLVEVAMTHEPFNALQGLMFASGKSSRYYALAALEAAGLSFHPS
jgi:hypothetical protein